MYDLVIKNGLIVDGSGADAYKADIAVTGDTIVRIGDLGDFEAAKVIDARGKHVTPGFIDPHSHADLNVLFHPSMEAYLMQGVTTAVGGNCGHAMAPLGDEVYRSGIVDFDVVFASQPSYFELVSLMVARTGAEKAIKELYNIDLDWKSFSEYIDKCNALDMDCNIAPLIGYSAIRGAVMGMDSMRDATKEELDRMARIVEDAMKAGAFGLSTGRDPDLIPGPFATDEETVRMLRIVAEHGGIFSCHTFTYDKTGTPDRMAGYREMLEQAKAAGVRANVSHVHVVGMAATPEQGVQAARDTLAYFEAEAAAGLDLSYDVIPSPYSTAFSVPYFAFYLKPFVLMSGSRAQLGRNFTVPDFRKMVRLVVKEMFPVFDPDQPASYYPLFVINRHKNPAHVGKNLAAYAQELGVDALALTMDLFAEDPDMCANVSMAGFAEANDILSRHPMAMPCSDGMCCSKDSNFMFSDEIPLNPNAMTISFIPRYILKHGKPRFEDTIRQISGFVAERFGIPKRGFLKEGYFADIVILDRENLRSYDMDENPLQYPDGFEYVIVNGVPTIENKKHLDASAGRMLRKV